MEQHEQERFDQFYVKHLQALKLQGKRSKTIDGYGRAVRRVAGFPAPYLASGWEHPATALALCLHPHHSTGCDANRFSPSCSERKAAVSWPRTLLPAPSSGGE